MAPVHAFAIVPKLASDRGSNWRQLGPGFAHSGQALPRRSPFGLCASSVARCQAQMLARKCHPTALPASVDSPSGTEHNPSSIWLPLWSVHEPPGSSDAFGPMRAIPRFLL